MYNENNKYKEALERAKNYYNTTNSVADAELIELIFPELKKSKDEKIRKDIRQCIKLCSFVPSNGTSKDEMFAWLEKQGGHKPDDKAEPKFHKGDWVVLTAGELSTTLQIVSVDINKKLYWFNDSSYLPIVDEQCLHHWTIQDAKDGDVLVRNNDMLSICIFSHFDGIYNKFSSFLCHCGLEGEGLGQELSINGYHDDSKNYLPATKEQRELLFQKIKEAGYEWDTEKKELKKIGNEIEIPFGAKDSELQEATYYIPKGFYAKIENDKVVIKKGEKPTAWSEEDEKMLEEIVNTVKDARCQSLLSE